MSKRGIIFVVLLAVFISSSQVFAVAKISLDKDVVIQSGNVEIKIRPDTAGVYKEIYLIDKQGKIIDSIILDCDAVCYEDKTISYSLPSTIQPGDYKIYVYDYSINNYIIYEFKVIQSQQPAKTFPSKKVSKYFYITHLVSDGKTPSIIRSKNIDLSGLVSEKDVRILAKTGSNNELAIVPNGNSKLIITNLNEESSPRIEIEQDSKGYILELESQPLIEYEKSLKDEINKYSGNAESLEEIKDKRNFILNIIIDIKLAYNNYKLKKSVSEFKAKRDKHIADVIDQHSKAKSRIRDKLPNAIILDEFEKSFNGLVVDKASITELSKISGIKKIHANKKVKALLNTTVPFIGAPDLWSIGYTGSGIKIGVIDTGVDYNHTDLGGCFGSGCKVEGGYDFVNDDNDPMDDQGHGTHVASTAAGNGLFKGVAPDANIYAYKVLDEFGSGYASAIIAGIERATDPNSDNNFTDHLDIISMSLGGPGNPDDAMSSAIDNAVYAGVVAVIAAGNDGPYEQTIGSPGTARKAITVGASTRLDEMAYFSSRGPVLWNDESLVKPEITAPGVLICAAQWGSAFNSSRCYQDVPNHIAISGTSMATPHVSGVAALLLQAHPTWTPQMVKSAMLINAKDIGYLPTVQGSGRVDAFNAYNTSIFVDTPIVQFGNLRTSIVDKTIKIKNIESYPISLSLTIGDIIYIGTNQTYPLITSNLSSFTLQPGEEIPVNLHLVSPNNGGEFYGTIYINESSREYRIPYYFTRFSTITLRAISPIANGYLAPVLVVADESLDNVQAVGFIFGEDDQSTFAVGAGNYTVYALGDFVTPGLNYVLMDKVQVPAASHVEKVLSTDDARTFTIKASSKSGEPLVMYNLNKNLLINTSYGAASVSLGAFKNGDYGDIKLYMTDTPVYDKIHSELEIDYFGVPARTPGALTYLSKNYFDTKDTAKEEYILSWHFPKIDSSTPSDLDYSINELAMYNLTFDYPSLDPAAFSSYYFFIHPFDYFAFAAGFNWMAVPVNREYNIKVPVINSQLNLQNWSFSSFSYLNYLKGDSNDNFAYSLMSREDYQFANAWDAINPVPGSKDTIYFGKTPLTPAQVKIENDRIKLNGFLAKGFKGKSTLYKEEVLFINPAKYYTINPPTYSIYQGGTLVSSGNITKRGFFQLAYWYPGVLNYTLSPGINIVNITVPIEYLVWNKTITTATISYPASDIQPPIINSVLASPRFSENSAPTVRLNITDDISLDNVTLYYRYDDSNWISIPGPYPVSNGLFVVTLPSTPQGTNKIDMKIKAIDSTGNKNELQILPASLPERTISLNLTANSTQLLPGQPVKISGRCVDSKGMNCTNLRIIHKLNNNPILVGRSDIPSYYYVALPGKLSYEWVTEPFLSTINFTYLFEGTGLYRGNQESSTNQPQLTQQQRDLGLRDLIIPQLEFNKTGNVSFKVYNAGTQTETNIPINLYLNSVLHASTTITINPGIESNVQLSFVPQARKDVILKINASISDNNAINNFIIRQVFIDHRLPDTNPTVSINQPAPYIYGTAFNRTFTISNSGKSTAKNIVLTEYATPNGNVNNIKQSTQYNIKNNITFNGTVFEFIPYYINSSYVTLHILSNNGISQNLTLFRYGGVSILPDSTLLDVTMFTTNVNIGLSRAYTIRTINIPDLTAKDSVLLNDSLLLNSLGKYRFIAVLSNDLEENKLDNFYEIIISSVLPKPDLVPSLTVSGFFKSQYYLSINKTNYLNVLLLNSGGEAATDAGYKLYANSTLINYSYIGLINPLASALRKVGWRPNNEGTNELTVIASTTDEGIPENNIYKKTFIAIQTKNITVTITNSSGYASLNLLSPLSTLGRIVGSPTVIELPYRYPYQLGFRKLQTFSFPNTLSFTTYYKDSITDWAIGLSSDYYSNIQDNNLSIYFLYANSPNWTYASTDYRVGITNPIVDYSNAYVYGCQSWDFTNGACLTGWVLQNSLRQFIYSGSQLTIIMNGSSPSNMQAFALAEGLPVSATTSTTTSTSTSTSTIITTPCTLNTASWNNTIANINQPVGMTITTSNCIGLTMNFEVWEQDTGNADDLANINPAQVTITTNTVSTTWTAEWQNDCLGACNPPEYYFYAYLASNPAIWTASPVDLNTFTTTTIISVVGGGGGGGGGSSSSSGSASYSAYSESLYYKLISKDNPFLGYTKSPLIDVKSIGVNTDELFSKDYIKISEYSYQKSDIAPNNRLVYSFFDIDHIQIPKQSILSSNITFRVPISWLATYSLNPESIILQRYTGSLWQDLATNLANFDSDYYYYTAEAPGLSTFAITYNMPEVQELTQTSIPQQPTSIIEQQQPVVGSINKLFYIIPVIFIALALILLFIGWKKNPAKILSNAIKNARKRGFSDEDIVKEATAQGWPEDLVRRTLNKPKF